MGKGQKQTTVTTVLIGLSIVVVGLLMWFGVVYAVKEVLAVLT